MNLKYLYEKCSNSKVIIVVFSACVREGLTARYNYVRTLKKVKANKIFILDDFAKDKRGCYYLGQYPEFLVEKSVNKLIADFIEKINALKIIFCGSSKGGWAALNFGLQNKICFGKVIIVGAPQYYLGNYICHFGLTFEYLRGVFQ